MTTRTTARPGPAPAAEQPASLLAELRALAETAPARAAAECWEYLRRAGAADDRELLGALFGQGAPPRLDGDYEGLVLGTLFGLPEVTLLNPVVAVDPGWIGKSFDAATGTGHNRLNRLAYTALRLVLPRYRGWQRGPHSYNGFRFEYRIRRAALPPFIDVAAVTYTAPALGNPGSRIAPIERVRDELVELLPGVHLGRALMSRGSEQIALVGYFALRAPQREDVR